MHWTWKELNRQVYRCLHGARTQEPFYLWTHLEDDWHIEPQPVTGSFLPSGLPTALALGISFSSSSFFLFPSSIRGI